MWRIDDWCVSIVRSSRCTTIASKRERRRFEWNSLSLMIAKTSKPAAAIPINTSPSAGPRCASLIRYVLSSLDLSSLPSLFSWPLFSTLSLISPSHLLPSLLLPSLFSRTQVKAFNIGTMVAGKDDTDTVNILTRTHTCTSTVIQPTRINAWHLLTELVLEVDWFIVYIGITVTIDVHWRDSGIVVVVQCTVGQFLWWFRGWCGSWRSGGGSVRPVPA